MTPADELFLELLQQDTAYLEQAMERIEDLLPQVSAPLQDQWRLEAQTRRDLALGLKILQEKAQALTQDN